VTHAFFGRKDYQQLKVIEAMVRDLNVGIQIVGCETVREPDGLAMSSRNQYLNPADRRRATRIWQALQSASCLAANGERDVRNLETEMRNVLTAASTTDDRCDRINGEESENRKIGVDKIDYAVVVDPDSLAGLEYLDHAGIALVAAHVGNTRLIDNLIIAT
jgi:pantoate--beta-alanine ligase